jgi:RNA polymerase sigma-70 factor (ECF subfamily)
MLPDSELVSRVILANDQSAFAQLVGRHQGAIRAFMRRLLAGDHAAADDLAQETFLAAYRKLHTWQAAASFSTWLHSIAYRKFLERVRKEARYQVMADVPEPESTHQAKVHTGPGSESGNEAESEILAQQLMALLGPEDRVCMTMAYSVGMSHEEISGLIDLPLGSVKSRIHRAKLKLQQWLKDHDYSVPQGSETPAQEKLHA